jgi:hypothetical protein
VGRYAAFREALPDMPEAEAKQQTTHAIAAPGLKFTIRTLWRKL